MLNPELIIGFFIFIFLVFVIYRVNTEGNGAAAIDREPRFFDQLRKMHERIFKEVFKGETHCELDFRKHHLLIDFETTDLSRRWGSVASVALGLVVDGVLVERAYTVVKPQHRMSERAREINGLSDSVLEGAPEALPILKALALMLPSMPLVSYNTFDLEILQDLTSSQDIDLSALPAHLDAMRLATNILNSGGKWLKLSEACEIMGIEHADAHHALADMTATAQLTQKLFEVISESDDETDFGKDWLTMTPIPSQKFSVTKSRAGVYKIVNQSNQQVGEIMRENSSEWSVQSFEDGAVAWFRTLTDATRWVKSKEFQA